jgi:Tfp pilus assembly protein PilN
MSDSTFSIGAQNGIGIDCEGATLRAVYVRGRGNRARVVDRLEIPEYREVGPAECGRRYAAFLRKHGLAAPQTVVALPREATLFRMLEFPKTVENELAKAVEYQVDAYQPWEEGSVYWDYTVWKWPEDSAWQKLTGSHEEGGDGKLEVLLGISLRKKVDEVAAWFEEAGIPVSQFNVKAALWISMFWPRLQEQEPKGRTLFVLHATKGRVELVGYTPGKEPVWQERVAEEAESPEAFDKNVKFSLEFSRSLLRVEPEERPPLLVCGEPESAAAWLGDGTTLFRAVPAEQFTGSLGEGTGFDRENGWSALAAGLEAAAGGGLLSINLLPAAKRTYDPGGTHLATYLLAGLVGLLTLALGMQGPVQDWLYAQHLQQQIEALQPELRQLELTRTSAEEAQQRLQVLDGARQSARVPLEVLNELTRILPPDVWLQQFTYDGTNVSLTGNAAAASGLLQMLAGSSLFENPQFRTSISRLPDGQERFAISARLRTGIADGGAPQ